MKAKTAPSEALMDSYSGTSIPDLIALSEAVMRLERKYVEAVSKLPAHRCEALIVQNCEDQYGRLCEKPCEFGKHYCPEHLVE